MAKYIETSNMQSLRIFPSFTEEIMTEKMNINIVQGKGDFQGGMCSVNSELYIVLNKLKPIDQRLGVLVREFSKLNLNLAYEELFVSVCYYHAYVFLGNNNSILWPFDQWLKWKYIKPSDRMWTETAPAKVHNCIVMSLK